MRLKILLILFTLLSGAWATEKYDEILEVNSDIYISEKDKAILFDYYPEYKSLKEKQIEMLSITEINLKRMFAFNISPFVSFTYIPVEKTNQHLIFEGGSSISLSIKNFILNSDIGYRSPIIRNNEHDDSDFDRINQTFFINPYISYTVMRKLMKDELFYILPKDERRWRIWTNENPERTNEYREILSGASYPAPTYREVVVSAGFEQDVVFNRTPYDLFAGVVFSEYPLNPKGEAFNSFGIQQPMSFGVKLLFNTDSSAWGFDAMARFNMLSVNIGYYKRFFVGVSIRHDFRSAFLLK